MFYAVAATLLAIALVLFHAPLRRTPGGTRDNSLRGVLIDTLKELPRHKPGVVALMIAAAVGCIAVFLPALISLAVATAPPHAHRSVLVWCGLALAPAAACTGLVYLLSGLTFGFGGGSRKPGTPMGRIAAAFPAVCAIASVAAGLLIGASE